jgi:hypothetical protein
VAQCLEQALSRPKDQWLIIDHYDPTHHHPCLSACAIHATAIHRDLMRSGEVPLYDRGSEQGDWFHDVPSDIEPAGRADDPAWWCCGANPLVGVWIRSQG